MIYKENEIKPSYIDLRNSFLQTCFTYNKIHLLQAHVRFRWCDLPRESEKKVKLLVMLIGIVFCSCILMRKKNNKLKS